MAAEGVASSVAGKVVDSLFGVAKKEISYMWNCKENVENLKNEVEHLKVMKGNVQQQIGIANGKGDNLKTGVEEWLKMADDQISKAEAFLEQEANAKKTCFRVGMCGNWVTLHRYGKGATKMAPPLLKLQERGSTYESGVSVYTPAPTQLDVYQSKNLDDLVTQNSALGDIIKSLEDESIQIIGIYGLGGVGKTTLAKEVVAKVKNTLFADVAFTTVSQNVKVEEIKKDIGEATKRIMKGDKILIILDDVWEKLNLEELCIPCGSNYMNCKILLTSRSQDVCNKMNAQSKICVNSLPKKEAWILFKRVVGEKVETDADLKPVAMKVAEECGGLPLLIQAVGNALKDKRIEIWNSALTQLKKHAPSEIDPDIRKAFTHLQLSYDYLESEEAKSCFLLCSLFPEDSYIRFEDLVLYGVGLRKFHDLDSIDDARGRVQNAMNILTSSCLLLNMEYEDEKPITKMHDVVRDVALLIASKGENKYLVEAGKGLTEWLPRDTSSESYAGISLMDNHIIKLPDYEVDLPRLDIFIISENGRLSMISDEFIRGMKEVKVLDMSLNDVTSLPQSLKLLTKLRMLDLRGNESFCEISILGELKDLEILILSRTGIKEIPQEIGQLVNLRRLDVLYCEHLCHITPGVISKLWMLEELYLDFRWMQKGVYDCVAEVMTLLKLTYLYLRVQCIDDIPEGFDSQKLKRFGILIGKDKELYSNALRIERYLFLSGDLRIPLLKWIKKLIEVRRPHIFLHDIQNLKNIMPALLDNEGFNDIQLNNCRSLSCLVDSTSCDRDQVKTIEKFLMELKYLALFYLDELEVIWKWPDEETSLTNLVKLTIYECKKLVNVCSVKVAQGLVNLKELTIRYCGGLEEVIYGGGGEEMDRGGTGEIVEQDSANTVIVFPSLAKITLSHLDSLKSFYSGNENCTIKYPSLVDVEVKYCESIKIWGPGIHETPNLKTLVGSYDVQVPLNGPNAINDAVAKVRR